MAQLIRFTNVTQRRLGFADIDFSPEVGLVQVGDGGLDLFQELQN